jgi:acetyl esterase/lipase
MERVTVRAGIVFDSSTAAPLALDAYLPSGLKSTERRPTIVFVSGAENVRRWRWFETWGRIAAARGFVAIVPDKRYPRGLEGLRAGFEDTEKLLAFLRGSGGAQLNVDSQRLCLWTFSAGGRLTSVGLQPGGPNVRCLVNFYGILDLSPEAAAVEEASARESLLRRYSPLHALESMTSAGHKPPPLFVARAGRDAPFINNGIDRFAAAALRLNAHVTLVNYAEGDHGFDGLNDTPQSKAIIEAALGFVREHTAAP